MFLTKMPRFFFLLRFAELQLVIEPSYGLIHARQVLDHAATPLTRKHDLKKYLSQLFDMGISFHFEF